MFPIPDFPTDIKITRITYAEVTNTSPKMIGKNSRKENHGDTSRERLVRVYTDSGHEGFGVTGATAKVLEETDAPQALGASPIALLNPETGIMISYDDPESLGHRAEYIVDQNLGGMMFWELSADDDDNSLLTTVFDIFSSVQVSNALIIDGGSGTNISLLDSELVEESSHSPTSNDLALAEVLDDGMETPLPPAEKEEEDPMPRMDDAFAEGDLLDDPLLDLLTTSLL